VLVAEGKQCNPALCRSLLPYVAEPLSEPEARIIRYRLQTWDFAS